MKRLHEVWTTPEQREFNAWRREHTDVCPDCDGQGVRHRAHRTACETCCGVGYVMKGGK